MSDRIQLTEEYARKILDECACTETCDFKLDETISVMKQKGYIIKSELQQKVEEAEEMYEKVASSLPGQLQVSYLLEVIDKHKAAIIVMKQSHPEFKR